MSRHRQVKLSITLIFFVVSVPLISWGGLEHHPQTLRGKTEHEKNSPWRTSIYNNADITFPTPKQFVLISEEAMNVKRLYSIGDHLFEGEKWKPVLKIERLEPHGVLFRQILQDKKVFIPFGKPLPGLPQLTLIKNLTVKELRYEFKVVKSLPDQEPRLIRMEGSRAYLEKELTKDSPFLPRPTPRRSEELPTQNLLLPKGLLSNLPVTRIDEDTFEVDKQHLGPLRDTLRESLQNPKESLEAAISLMTKNILELKTPDAHGRLSRQGFTLIRMDEAQKLGLQVGDTILSINDQKVTSALTAWGIASTLVEDSNVTELHVLVHREGALLTRTYQLK